MEKKSTNAIVIAVSVLAVCVVAVVCALILKANGSGIIKTQSKEEGNSKVTENFEEETTYNFDEPAGVVIPSEEVSVTLPTETTPVVTEKPTQAVVVDKEDNHD